MKKNNKYTIKKNNYNRILLTELLPYEVPIILNNEGFYYKKNSLYEKSEILRTIFSAGTETYPISFKIIKIGDDTRKLYLMHPSNQKDFVGFYKTYNALICHLTQRSKFSLRAPSDIASWFYDNSKTPKDNSIKDEDIETVNDSDSRDVKYASSFFVYKKYSFLYKFYDSYEFHRLEKKYKKLVKFDISKCFDNISTKRLAESVKEEHYAKNNKGEINFENKFITLMESANFGRNDGILIGPEVSRIFAEIILQKIDRNVYSSNSYSGYEVRRYVDDYFLFYNDDSIGRKILSAFKVELENAKLFLNESKIEYSVAPFLTGTSMAKKDLQDIFSNLFDTFDESKKGNGDASDPFIDDDKVTFIKFNKNPGLAANKLIRDIKAIVIRNNTRFESIIGYFFTTIKNKLNEIYQYTLINDFDEEQYENITKFIKVIFDVSFFVYSMDKRVRSTFLISQICILSYRIATSLSDEYESEILKKLQDELIFVVKNGHSNSPEGIESVNLLIVLGAFDRIEHDLSTEEVCRFVFQRPLKELNDASYFQIISLLYFIKDNKLYSELKSRLLTIVIDKIKERKCSLYSESAHIFLDLLSCPYLNDAFKKKMINTVTMIELEKKLSTTQIKKELELISNSYWFVDWSEEGINIERLLQKKELKSAYD